MSGPPRILIVDDERVMCETMAAWLHEDGHEVDTAATGPAALELVRERQYAIAFIDLKMPGGMDGIQTMTAIKRLQPEVAAIIITAFATVDSAVEALRDGAEDYLLKPCNPHHISILVERILRVRELEQSNRRLRNKLLRKYEFHDILSKSPRMAEIVSLVRDIASLKSTVLILGESGTGKEMIARAIHQEGQRKDGPFVAVPCAALTETLLESELFGHERGAFTGADSMHRGKVELARGGTLFLDEIGDISAKMQRDLLRFLQEHTYFRVGGNQELHVDVRVIAATHRDLIAEIRAERFRQDLYYRLNVINIRLPALRDRREDIPLLADHFLNRISDEVGKSVTSIEDAALRILMAHDWPGNVRELENAVERAVVTSDGGKIKVADVSFLVDESRDRADWVPPGGMSLAELEQVAIEAALERTGWNVSRAAAALGIDRSTLYDKINRYGLTRPSDAEPD